VGEFGVYDKHALEKDFFFKEKDLVDLVSNLSLKKLLIVFKKSK